MKKSQENKRMKTIHHFFNPKGQTSNEGNQNSKEAETEEANQILRDTQTPNEEDHIPSETPEINSDAPLTEEENQILRDTRMSNEENHISRETPEINSDAPIRSPSLEETTMPFTTQDEVANPIEITTGSLERDPAKRTPIWKHNVNQMDEIRRAYIKMGPYQPSLLKYPATAFGKQNRRFQKSWFNKFPWLEYSEYTNKVFCFPCFLFESEIARYSTFTTTGFGDWKRVNNGDNCPFLTHIGGPTSIHNNAVNAMLDLMNGSRHVDKAINVQKSEEKEKNRLRLETTIESVQWLSMQACALRGHDESTTSKNRGNFLELVKLMARRNPAVEKVVLDNAPKNSSYTSSDIQKEILQIIANKVRKQIREEVGDGKFCILVDEAKDAAGKEQMVIILRFVDIKGCLRERFFEIVHVPDTTAATLKKAICDVLKEHNLQISNMRGQGYDGASNMRGILNGLQALFLRESPYAYYVHCFAHRLQLALVGTATKEGTVLLFFQKLTCIVNFITASPKRQGELQCAQAIEIEHMIEIGERKTGRGANQIGTLKRAGQTRWSSHFESMSSLMDMFSAVLTVLYKYVEEGPSHPMHGEAIGCLRAMESFEFVFILHLMHRIMAITDLLCRELQHKKLDIVNAMSYVSYTKTLLQTLRSESYDIHLEYVKSVCLKNDIQIPNMDEPYSLGTERVSQRKRKRTDSITFHHHYHFDLFNVVIDFQLEELNTRFKDDVVELLTLSSALEPRDNFKLFDADKICCLAKKFYPDDFTDQDMHQLRSQLAVYKMDIDNHERFQDITTISDLCEVLVETKKNQTYNLIDRLIRLVLILPVSTATAERAFSSMKLIKTNLRNSMESYLNDSMAVYIERDIMENIDVDSIIVDFFEKKHRRTQV